ncbi:MAG TPA: cell wall hydrolase [Rhizomicrobium sp.]|nr:cell wall hydrolase [Rhizomicrobium sp.]
MTKMRDVLRRADRTAAFALLLVFATVSGAATSGNAPAANHQYTNNPSTAQLRGIVAEAARPASVTREPLLAADAIQASPSAVELAMVKFAGEERCLAEVMYYEARGEGVEGEEAIAEVVFHRMHRRGYPTSICGVVYQGMADAPACQFSFVCNGDMRRPKAAADWARAKLLAAKILSGYTILGNITGGATSFHAVDVEPDWSSSLERTVQIGNHIFYKPLPRTQAS